MPEGIFIPISTMFRSIADSKRSSSEVSHNLMTTFDKLPKNSQEGQVARPAPITIAPTELNNMEVETSLLTSQMTQTDVIGMPTFPIAESKEVQTEMPARKDCEMQASSNSECKAVQTTEIEIDSQHVQTEVGESKEVHMKEPEMTTSKVQMKEPKMTTSKVQIKEPEVTTSEVQTECSVESSHSQMEQVTDKKASQSEPADSDTRSIQTEKQGHEKENQTEIKNDDREIQTEVKFDDRANETDINSSNIVTVNCIEVVQEMLSWGTQTDLDELESMEPIIPSEIITCNDIDSNKMKDNLSETESVFSSASKMAEAQMQGSHSKPRDEEVVSLSLFSGQEEAQQPSSSQGAGLDMRRGEYFELDFPPVTTTNVP